MLARERRQYRRHAALRLLGAMAAIHHQSSYENNMMMTTAFQNPSQLWRTTITTSSSLSKSSLSSLYLNDGKRQITKPLYMSWNDWSMNNDEEKKDGDKNDSSPWSKKKKDWKTNKNDSPAGGGGGGGWNDWSVNSQPSEPPAPYVSSRSSNANPPPAATTGTTGPATAAPWETSSPPANAAPWESSRTPATATPQESSRPPATAAPWETQSRGTATTTSTTGRGTSPATAAPWSSSPTTTSPTPVSNNSSGRTSRTTTTTTNERKESQLPSSAGDYYFMSLPKEMEQAAAAATGGSYFLSRPGESPKDKELIKQASSNPVLAQEAENLARKLGLPDVETLKKALDDMHGFAPDGSELDPIKAIYLQWCDIHNRQPDESRFAVFLSNYYQQQPSENNNNIDDIMSNLNEYSDITDDDYSRIRTAYLEWCTTNGKQPNDSRFPIFLSNYLRSMDRRNVNGNYYQTTKSRLNEYADCTPEEYTRVRQAYEIWCRDVGKRQDESRFGVFLTNYLATEAYAKENGLRLELTEYADRTAEEYDAMAGDVMRGRYDDDDIGYVGGYYGEHGDDMYYKAPSGARTETSLPKDTNVMVVESLLAAEKKKRIEAETQVNDILHQTEAQKAKTAEEEATRILMAYIEWCEENGKLPEKSRFPFFLSNYLKMEQYAQANGIQDVTLNEYADSTDVDYERVREIYVGWCQKFRKTPDYERRFPVFVSNYLQMEDNAKRQGVRLQLTQYADCTAEEYNRIPHPQRNGNNNGGERPQFGRRNGIYDQRRFWEETARKAQTKKKYLERNINNLLISENRKKAQMDANAAALRSQSLAIEEEAERSRVTLAYIDWCKQNGKEPKESRFQAFMENYLRMEEDMAAVNEKRRRGGTAAVAASSQSSSSSTTLQLNEFSDCTPDEYDTIVAAYEAWCHKNQRQPTDERFQIFMEQYLEMEDYSRSNRVRMELNEYMDCREEEYARIRLAYIDWCQRQEVVVDEARFPVFFSNYLRMEDVSRKEGVPMRELLDEFADCTEEEFESRSRQNWGGGEYDDDEEEEGGSDWRRRSMGRRPGSSGRRQPLVGGPRKSERNEYAEMAERLGGRGVGGPTGRSAPLSFQQRQRRRGGPGRSGPGATISDQFRSGFFGPDADNYERPPWDDDDFSDDDRRGPTNLARTRVPVGRNNMESDYQMGGGVLRRRPQFDELFDGDRRDSRRRRRDESRSQGRSRMGFNDNRPPFDEFDSERRGIPSRTKNDIDNNRPRFDDFDSNRRPARGRGFNDEMMMNNGSSAIDDDDDDDMVDNNPRIRDAYETWCKKNKRTPSDSRYRIFSSNYRQMKHPDEQLDESADCTDDEYNTIRTLYNDWCRTNNRIPSESRWGVFLSNYLAMEEKKQQNTKRGGVTAQALNEYSDCTNEEYEQVSRIYRSWCQQHERQQNEKRFGVFLSNYFQVLDDAALEKGDNSKIKVKIDAFFDCTEREYNRIRSAYERWCQMQGKSFDEERLGVFLSNYIRWEEEEKRTGVDGVVEMKLQNKFADHSEVEMARMPKGPSSSSPSDMLSSQDGTNGNVDEIGMRRDMADMPNGMKETMTNGIFDKSPSLSTTAAAAPRPRHVATAPGNSGMREQSLNDMVPPEQRRMADVMGYNNRGPPPPGMMMRDNDDGRRRVNGPSSVRDSSPGRFNSSPMQGGREEFNPFNGNGGGSSDRMAGIPMQDTIMLDGNGGSSRAPPMQGGREGFNPFNGNGGGSSGMMTGQRRMTDIPMRDSIKLDGNVGSSRGSPMQGGREGFNPFNGNGGGSPGMMAGQRRMTDIPMRDSIKLDGNFGSSRGSPMQGGRERLNGYGGPSQMIADRRRVTDPPMRGAMRMDRFGGGNVSSEMMGNGDRRRVGANRPMLPGRRDDMIYDDGTPLSDPRIRTAYQKWCKTNDRTPSDARYRTFVTNFLQSEQMAFENNMPPPQLDNTADCTDQEFANIRQKYIQWCRQHNREPNESRESIFVSNYLRATDETEQQRSSSNNGGRSTTMTLQMNESFDRTPQEYARLRSRYLTWCKKHNREPSERRWGVYLSNILQREEEGPMFDARMMTGSGGRRGEMMDDDFADVTDREYEMISRSYLNWCDNFGREPNDARFGVFLSNYLRREEEEETNSVRGGAAGGRRQNGSSNTAAAMERDEFADSPDGDRRRNGDRRQMRPGSFTSRRDGPGPATADGSRFPVGFQSNNSSNDRMERFSSSYAGFRRDANESRMPTSSYRRTAADDGFSTATSVKDRHIDGATAKAQRISRVFRR